MMAVNSCKIRKAVMCETGAFRRGVVKRRRNLGRRDSIREILVDDAGEGVSVA